MKTLAKILYLLNISVLSIPVSVTPGDETKLSAE